MYRQRSEVLKWLIVFLVIGVGGWFWWQNREHTDEIDWMNMMNQEAQVERCNNVPQRIGVHIAGAVKEPGVYFLPADSRVVDLLKVAGGVKADADLNQINLAASLIDGQKVIVPESELYALKDVGSVRGKIDGKVSLNNSSIDELMTLSGIGPSKAEAIIHFREENGPFRKLEDLLKVSGIGEKTFERLKSQITLF